MLQYLALLVMLNSVLAKETVTMNEIVDQRLVHLNSLLPSRAPIAFNITSPPHIELYKGFFFGLNTLYRTKDNTMIMYDNGTFSYDFHAGFRKFIAEYDHASIDETPFTGEFRAKKSSFRISFYAYINFGSGNCDVTVTNFGLEELDKVSLRTDNGVKDVSELVQTHVLPKLNQELNSPQIKDSFMQGLQRGFCGKIRQLFGMPSSRSKRSADMLERMTAFVAQGLVPQNKLEL